MLTKWNYTKEEWRNFLHWKTKQKGMVFFFIRKLMPVRSAHVPEIRITVDTVWVNNTQQSFHDDQRSFRDVNIREAGKVNILAINYRQGNKVREINLPIPKGKLREAIIMQERLNMETPGRS